MVQRAPLSVIIPALDAAGDLPATLAALAPAAVEGLIREVILVDGGSSDETRAIAEAAGAAVVMVAPGRGGQLAEGARRARGDWLLFLHADTVLEKGWAAEAAAFMRAPAPAAARVGAAVFTLAFNANGVAPKLVAAGAMIRTRFFGAPYGDQGLLLSRAHYEAAGGYRSLPLMEDVEFADRLRREGPMTILKSRAITSAARYERDGYGKRVLKNLCCILLYRFGVAPEKIAAFYR